MANSEISCHLKKKKSLLIPRVTSYFLQEDLHVTDIFCIVILNVLSALENISCYKEGTSSIGTFLSFIISYLLTEEKETSKRPSTLLLTSIPDLKESLMIKDTQQILDRLLKFSNHITVIYPLSIP